MILFSTFAAICLLGAAAGRAWHAGTPYQEPFLSPDGRYHIQKYATLSPRSLLGSMPGQSSDMVDGFIRLHDGDGTVLAERWVAFMRDIRPVWSDDRVYLLGIAEMDNNPWLLPAPSTDLRQVR